MYQTKNVSGARIHCESLFLSSFLGQFDRLFDCRLLLKIMRQKVAQFGVQQMVVVETINVVGNVVHGVVCA